MTTSTVYTCDRCQIVQATPNTLHHMSLALTGLSGLPQAVKTSDWCDTCLMACGLVTNGVLDLTPISNLTVTQLAQALGQPYIPVVKP